MIHCHEGCGRSTKIADITEKLIKRAKAHNAQEPRDALFSMIDTIQVNGRTTAQRVKGRWSRMYRRRK
jgi:hypothetical protein